MDNNKKQNKTVKLKTLIIVVSSVVLAFIIAIGGFLWIKWDALFPVSENGAKVSTEAVKKDEKILIYTEDGESYIDAIEGLGRNPYSDSSFFTDDNGFKAYKDNNGKNISEVGIDISAYQGDVDWNKVKNAGVDYVMLRCGGRGYAEEGTLYEDSRFEENARGAIDAGLDVGVYFFSQAMSTEEAKEEADYTVSKIKKFNITYPVAFDWEIIAQDNARTDNVDGELLTQMARTFCDEISAKGYEPMIYSSRHLLYFTYDLAQLSDIDLWIASYGETPKFYYNFAMWQYSTEGTMYGIDGTVDLNVNLYNYN